MIRQTKAKAKKYIRTNDGVFEVVEEKNSYFIVEKDDIFFNDKLVCPVFKTSKYTGADTIEELIDDYVLSENNKYCIIGDIEAREMAAYEYGKIYGAIWVLGEHDEPILKPVSEMNREGKLCLL